MSQWRRFHAQWGRVNFSWVWDSCLYFESRASDFWQRYRTSYWSHCPASNLFGKGRKEQEGEKGEVLMHSHVKTQPLLTWLCSFLSMWSPPSFCMMQKIHEDFKPEKRSIYCCINFMYNQQSEWFQRRVMFSYRSKPWCRLRIDWSATRLTHWLATRENTQNNTPVISSLTPLSATDNSQGMFSLFVPLSCCSR
jgi:hypothetical protein